MPLPNGLNQSIPFLIRLGEFRRRERPSESKETSWLETRPRGQQRCPPRAKEIPPPPWPRLPSCCGLELFRPATRQSYSRPYRELRAVNGAPIFPKHARLRP